MSKSGFDRNLKSERRLGVLEDRVEGKALKTKKRNKRHHFGAEWAANEKVEFQLYLGDKPFPRFKMMTVFERAPINRDLEDKFSRTFDKHGETNRHLSSWRFVDYKTYNQASRDYVEGRMEGQPCRWPGWKKERGE
jgi:hypothetical protein